MNRLWSIYINWRSWILLDIWVEKLKLTKINLVNQNLVSTIKWIAACTEEQILTQNPILNRFCSIYINWRSWILPDISWKLKLAKINPVNETLVSTIKWIVSCMYRGTNSYLKPYFDTSSHLNSLFFYAYTTDKPFLVFEVILDLPLVKTSHSYSYFCTGLSINLFYF